jgi:hypothetical protein
MMGRKGSAWTLAGMNAGRALAPSGQLLAQGSDGLLLGPLRR